MSLETEIVQLNGDQLDKFFESTPDGTPHADNIEGGKEPEGTPKEKVAPIKPIVQAGSGIDAIPFIDEDDTSDDEGGKDDTPPKDDKEGKKEDAPKKDDGEPAEDKDFDTGTPEEVSKVLKNTVDYLVQQGLWEDFEGREGLDITQENYAELAAQQEQYKINQMFSELVDSTGAYGKAIISHIKNGGNPDEVIDIFKEQKQIEAIDTNNESGKEMLVTKYYKDILGWKQEKIEKNIKRLISDNELDSEFNDVKDLYKQHHDQQLAKVQEQQQEKEKVQKERQQAFYSNIKEAIDIDETLSPQEKRTIASSVLDFKHRLDNGQRVNDFYVKFAEMQANPKEYVKLVKFVMDPEKYEKTIEKKESSAAAKKAFNFIKGNAAVEKAKSASVTIKDKQSGSSYKGTDFSFAIKNR